VAGVIRGRRHGSGKVIGLRAAETRNFDGTAVVIFQPAEEGSGGGREMVKDGLMGRFGIETGLGMHNLPAGRSAASRSARARSSPPRRSSA
jgi:metal-dependent amidase/aminoacylase/carboxypeptidase family protein